MEEDDKWNYAIAFPVIWMPAINGDIDIEGGDKVDINVSFDDILDKLSAGIMGSLSATKGDWGVGLSVNYLKTEDETKKRNLQKRLMDMISDFIPKSTSKVSHSQTKSISIYILERLRRVVQSI